MSHACTWRYPADAWQWACGTIQSRGDLVKTEDGKLTKEIMNLMVTVLNPGEGWPIAGSEWDLTALNRYSEQLLSHENPGFDYTYGERLRGYPISRWSLNIGHFNSDRDLSQDQIQDIISKLRKNPNTRRAIAITWVPEIDNKHHHVPCLQSVNFLYRQIRLHMTAYFRSHDFARAWPANLYGLNKLLQYVGKETGLTPGSITTISVSAHIYEA